MGRPPKCCCLDLVSYACHSQCETTKGTGSLTRFNHQTGRINWTRDLGTTGDGEQRQARGVTIDAAGNAWVVWATAADRKTNVESSDSNRREGVAKYTPSGSQSWLTELVTPAAGGLSGTADSPPLKIRLNNDESFAWLLTHKDSSNNFLHKVDPDGVATTYDQSTAGFGSDNPIGLGFAPDGDLWTVQKNNNLIVRFDPDAISATFESNVDRATYRYLSVAPGLVQTVLLAGASRSVTPANGICPLTTSFPGIPYEFAHKLDNTNWQGGWFQAAWKKQVCDWSDEVWRENNDGTFYAVTATPTLAIFGTPSALAVEEGTPPDPDEYFAYSLWAVTSSGAGITSWKSALTNPDWTNQNASFSGYFDLDVDSAAGDGLAAGYLGSSNPYPTLTVFSAGSGSPSKFIELGDCSDGFAADTYGVAIRTL